MVLTLLWIPGLKYPVVSDTLRYAALGESVWERWTYEFAGSPYALHLPFHAFFSYPFTVLLGVNLGMKVSTLVAGWGVLVMTFLLMRRSFSPTVAAWSVIAVLLHPAFVLMTMLGSADLLFTALFLCAVWLFLKAGDDRRFYIPMGIVAGLLCLTRYNGVPLLPVLGLYILWRRRSDLCHSHAWIGFGLAAAIASVWFVRNWIAFGNPLFTGYTAELGVEAPNLLEQFLSNVLYYGNPIHNVFPLLFPFALCGLWRFGRRQPVLLLSLIGIWALTAIWWVQAMRFAFPGYPILIAFAVAGYFDLAARLRLSHVLASILFVAGLASVHLPALCLYTYGECNAQFDRHIGLLPKNLGLTPEGFYAWHRARQYVNENAPPGAAFLAHDEMDAAVLREGAFRPDIRVVTPADPPACPLFRIDQRRSDDDQAVFETEEWPKTYVISEQCEEGESQ